MTRDGAPKLDQIRLGAHVAVSNDEKRLGRIASLADELRDTCTADSDQARARCQIIVAELAELFRAEEIYRAFPDASLIQRAEKAVQAAREARRQTKEAREVMSLERTMLQTTLNEIRAVAEELAAAQDRLAKLLKPR